MGFYRKSPEHVRFLNAFQLLLKPAFATCHAQFPSGISRGLPINRTYFAVKRPETNAGYSVHRLTGHTSRRTSHRGTFSRLFRIPSPRFLKPSEYRLTEHTFGLCPQPKSFRRGCPVLRLEVPTRRGFIEIVIRCLFVHSRSMAHTFPRHTRVHSRFMAHTFAESPRTSFSYTKGHTDKPSMVSNFLQINGTYFPRLTGHTWRGNSRLTGHTATD